MRLAYAPYMLDFREPAGTSRGVLRKKLTCFIKVWDENAPEVCGIGEAALFEGLSKEAGAGYELKLLELLANVALGLPTDLTRFPSIQMGFEQALLDFASAGRGVYWPSPFTAGLQTIEINGLVWMGNREEMLRRLEQKMEQGFRCVKFKIGAIDFQSELDLLRRARERFSERDLEIRVDANGAFNIEHVFPALNALEGYKIHSIEQPIAAGQWEMMKMVCQVSPIPVALDEELIGRYTTEEKREMLAAIEPAYVVLKPSLCGGFSGAREWIDLCKEHKVGWWVTSALESNVGLSALAQWVATLDTKMPQGLGTGGLFVNNFETGISLQGCRLGMDPDRLPVDRRQFEGLDWRQ